MELIASVKATWVWQRLLEGDHAGREPMGATMTDQRTTAEPVTHEDSGLRRYQSSGQSDRLDFGGRGTRRRTSQGWLPESDLCNQLDGNAAPQDGHLPRARGGGTSALDALQEAWMSTGRCPAGGRPTGLESELRVGAQAYTLSQCVMTIQAAQCVSSFRKTLEREG